MKNDWIRYEPNRTKSEVFICPYCKGRVYYRHHKSGQCEYKFCPRCGNMIISEMSRCKKHIPTKNGMTILELSCFGYYNPNFKMTAEFQRVDSFLRITLDNFNKIDSETIKHFMSEATDEYFKAEEERCEH